MRRNRIILTGDRGWDVEGIIGAGLTPKPGTIVQMDPTVALQGNRHTWVLYNADADGGRPKGPLIVLKEDLHQGKTYADAYAAGTRAFGFIPLAGCELNLLYKNESGTADDVVAGDIFIVDDTSGMVTLTTGTPETEVAMALEAATDPTEDTLVWSIWTGY